MYTVSYKVGSASGPSNNTFGLGYYNGNFLSYAYYLSGNIVKSAFMKTSPNNYDRSKNYNDCSANFEILPVSEDANGQRILLKAMNKNALFYEWLITDFCAPIYSNFDTISIYYPDSPNYQFPNLGHVAVLTVREQNGCKDSILQIVTVKTKASTYASLKTYKSNEIDIALFPNPVKDKFLLKFDQDTMELKKIFVINSLSQVIYQWNDPLPEQSFNISSLTEGIYFIKAANDDGQKMFKIIKE